MKAFILEKYGPPEVLQMAEVEKPAPAADEALVKVLAVSVNPADWHSMRGKPQFSRATLGLRRPKHQLLGVDIAGKVEAVGPEVSRFQPGDAVFGWCDGSFAEYVLAPEIHLAAMPANVSFEQAAVVPISGFAALQALRDVGRVQPGQRVLVIGAAGAVGSFAVQLAKAFGATVTGVAGTGWSMARNSRVSVSP